MPPDYLVIGHVTQDLLPDGSFQAGGTATYSALAASRLGLGVGVLTSARVVAPLAQGGGAVEVCCRPAAQTTTFENIYHNGNRQQYIRALAEPLSATDLPASWVNASIVHLGPVAQEVDSRLAGCFPQALIGITPQGWLRHWDAQGLVTPVPWTEAEYLLPQVDVVVLSLEDLGGDRHCLERYCAWARLVILTVGREGAIVYQQGRQERVPAYLVTEVDPTGAGDVFASAYFVRLHETGNVIESARFANSAASFAVEGVGTSTIPSREQVEWRLRHGRLGP